MTVIAGTHTCLLSLMSPGSVAMTPTIPGGPIEITGVRRAQRIKRKFEAVISIEAPGIRWGDRLRFHRHPHPAHLVLSFEDLDQPHPPIFTANEGHVETALNFARERPDATLLIHCHAGISRSTAIALAIIADRLGPGREGEALECMLHLQSEAVPNLLVVQHADRRLGRDGALLNLVLTWDRPRRWNQYRRLVNWAAVLSDYPGHGES
jgi:predicted protein tyrosine phosphatase